MDDEYKMRIEADVKLGFDDVYIRPKRSSCKSRAEVDILRTFKTINSGLSIRGLPIIASNMDVTGTKETALVLENYSAFTCLHKFYSVPQLLDIFKSCFSDLLFYSMGMGEQDYQKYKEFKEQWGGQFNICIDVANGYMESFDNFCRKMREENKNSIIMAGDVCTPEMVETLILNAGVDIIKIGIGCGTSCLTSIITGVGYPQLSAIIETADAAHGLKAQIVSDGGCKKVADICKAFGGGADFVMLGNMLSACDENKCNGEWKQDDEGEWFQKVYGMSSFEAQLKYYKEIKKYRAAEGSCKMVKCKGSMHGVVQEIIGGLRSCITYVGAKNLKELFKRTTFVKIYKGG